MLAIAEKAYHREELFADSQLTVLIPDRCPVSLQVGLKLIKTQIINLRSNRHHPCQSHIKKKACSMNKPFNHKNW